VVAAEQAVVRRRHAVRLAGKVVALDAAVGMMAPWRVSLTPLEGHLQSLADLGGVQASWKW